MFIPIIHLGTWRVTLGTISQTWTRTPFMTLYMPTLTGATMTIWLSTSPWTMYPQPLKYMVIPLFQRIVTRANDRCFWRSTKGFINTYLTILLQSPPSWGPSFSFNEMVWNWTVLGLKTSSALETRLKTKSSRAPKVDKICSLSKSLIQSEGPDWEGLQS